MQRITVTDSGVQVCEEQPPRHIAARAGNPAPELSTLEGVVTPWED